MHFELLSHGKPLKGVRPIALDGDYGGFVTANRLLWIRLSDLHCLSSVILPLPHHRAWLGKSRLLMRLLRIGIQCGVIWGEEIILAGEGVIMSVARLGHRLHEPRIESQLTKGRAPLNLVAIRGVPGFDDGVVYGEYFSNPLRAPVGIMRRDARGRWDRVYEFPTGEINHIHNLIPDPVRGCVWVLAGDFDQSASVWIARRNFTQIEPVVRGTQDVRACVAFPIASGLLYATDSQFQKNTIRVLRQEPDGWVQTAIQSLNGPVIHGAKIAGLYVFSTATEPRKSVVPNRFGLFDVVPAPAIARNESQLIIGTPSGGFEIVMARAKDLLPYRLFQFGNICFPSGESELPLVFIYSIANRGVNMSTEVFLIKHRQGLRAVGEKDSPTT